jgi:hypothetical protein
VVLINSVSTAGEGKKCLDDGVVESGKRERNEELEEKEDVFGDVNSRDK